MPWSSFFECWILKPAFTLSSFTFIKRLFSSSLLSAKRVVSSAYLRLLVFLPAILIPACASSSLAFHMMYSAYKLISRVMYSFPNFETVCCSMSGSNCCFLTCIQVSQKASKAVWYSYLFKNFLVCCDSHSQWLYSMVNEAEVGVFLELSCFFYDPMDVVNLISGSSAFSKSMNIWKFSVHILWKPSLENYEHYLASMWNECNCVVVWTFFVTTFLWDWNENWPFPCLWPLLSFPNLLAHWVQ